MMDALRLFGYRSSMNEAVSRRPCGLIDKNYGQVEGK
jgi:hypothetical protein